MRGVRAVLFGIGGLCLGAAFCVLQPGTAASQEKSLNVKVGNTSARNVHLRKGASSRTAAIAYVPVGTVLPATGECAGSWCKVIFREKEGWIYQKFLLPTNEDQTLFGIVTPAGDGAAKVDLQSLPGDGLPANGSLPSGTVVMFDLAHCLQNWCRVRSGEAEGWLQLSVLRRDDGNPFELIDPEDKPAPLPQAEPLPPARAASPATGQAELVADDTEDEAETAALPPEGSAAMIDRPQATTPAPAPAAESAPQPARPAAAAEAAPAPRVTAALTPQPEKRPAKQPEPAGQSAGRPGTYSLAGVPAGGSLVLRKEASATAEIVGAVPYDAANIEGLGQCSREWCLVRFAGTTGFILRRHLVRSDVTGSQRYRVDGVDLDSVVDVFAFPGPDAEVVGAIPPFATGLVEVGNCDRAWCHVRYFGVVGWVNTRFLVPEETTRAAN